MIILSLNYLLKKKRLFALDYHICPFEGWGVENTAVETMC